MFGGAGPSTSSTAGSTARRPAGPEMTSVVIAGTTSTGSATAVLTGATGGAAGVACECPRSLGPWTADPFTVELDGVVLVLFSVTVVLIFSLRGFLHGAPLRFSYSACTIGRSSSFEVATNR